MSGTPDAGSDSQGFTCSALLMCLYLPGLSKKKPETEAAVASEATVETSPAPASAANEEPDEHEPPAAFAPSRAASLDKSECASLYSGKNIVFDFVEDEGYHHQVELVGGARDLQLQGYCPSPCFDLPVELIRAGERFAADSDAPVTAAFVFGDDDGGHRGGGALQKMASCLAPGGEGSGEMRPPPQLVRFLSAASGRSSSVARPPVMVMPSRAVPQAQGKVVDGDCVLGDGACKG